VSPTPDETIGTSFEVDTNIYSLEAIKKSAYRFADRAGVDLSFVASNKIQVTLVPSCKNAVDLQQMVSEFRSELLDQDLREIIKRETAPIRNLILAHAFSRTRLVQQE
jgi:His-Xaa-Ser system protein HxsD